MGLNGRMEGRVAVITGGARGFGWETALRLSEEGASVAIWDVGAPPLGEVDDVRSKRLMHVWVDISDQPGVDSAAAETRAAFGPIHTLVNNAGIASTGLPWEVDDVSWNQHLAVNLSGAFRCTRVCLDDMRTARYGKIVNIGSLAGQTGRKFASPAYAASKGGILALTMSLAANLGEYGICVNAINPGFIRTQIHDSFTTEQLAKLTADIPLQRRGKAGEHGRTEDVPNAVLFLASSESDYITGQFLNVNGGMRMG